MGGLKEEGGIMFIKITLCDQLTLVLNKKTKIILSCIISTPPKQIKYYLLLLQFYWNEYLFYILHRYLTQQFSCLMDASILQPKIFSTKM